MRYLTFLAAEPILSKALCMKTIKKREGERKMERKKDKEESRRSEGGRGERVKGIEK